MVGRNEPCPCGSGKKYKKCCLRKDLEAERIEREARDTQPMITFPTPPIGQDQPVSSPDRTAELLNPQAQAWEERWEAFEEEDYQGHVAIFLESMSDGVLDDEMAFEMLDTLYAESIEHDERERFDELVAMFRERLPDVYYHSASFYLRWLIINAVVTGRLEDIPPLAREIASTAGADIDTFFNVVDMLAYHGQLPVLAEMMRIAWPDVKTSSEIMPWVVDEFSETAINYALFDYVERTADPRADDAELLAAMGYFLDLDQPDPDQVSRHLAHLTGQAGRHWTATDFDLASDQGAQNLFWLTVEFAGYMRWQEGVAYTKGELAREQVFQYLMKRHAGDLDPADDLFAPRQKPRKKRRTPAPKDSSLLLCPDRETLDRFLANLLNFLNPQFYKAGATFELHPAWLRFLEKNGLISTDRRMGTLDALSSLAPQMREVCGRDIADPALGLALEGSGERAPKG